MARFNTAATAVAKWSEDLSAPDLGAAGAEDAFAGELGSQDDNQDAFVDELKPGHKLLQGQYTIVSYLNSGGFGITYLAKDSLDRTIVIKECFPNSLCRRSGIIVRARSRAHQGEFRSVVRLFVQEARSLAKLVHPNIVGVHQVFEDNDTAYMAIDYVNGKDLLDVLEASDCAFTPDEIVQMLKKVLGAVDFVHQSGMLHRDISPDNILVDTRTKNPVLIDFGAAREQATKASRVMSQRRVVKDGYSPQEFYLTGSAQGPYSDLYALAATFYHVIAGAAPPESQRRLASIAEGSPDPYQPLAGRFQGYPPGFLEAIDKAARVLPRDRLETAAQWLDIIIAAEAGPVAQPAPAAPVAPTRFARKINPAPDTTTAVFAAQTAEVRSSRFPLLLGASSVVALGLGFALWTSMSDPATSGAATAQTAGSVVEVATALAAADALAAREAEAQTRAAVDAQAAAQARADVTAKAAVDATASAAAE
ncbi:MAG: serine/threonine-protein kinase, partial [Tabrizicola sp.]|uniref:serine/threonine-protein kinase n=1 Tax=Tabrizicola sp. TaxID=2005166 RepID=UPI002735EB3C